MASEKLSEKMLGEAFECSGMWWLPQQSKQHDESPEHLYGTLEYSPGEGIILTTFGSFESSIEEIMATFSSDNAFSLEIVAGISSNGERITLLNCFQAGVSMGEGFVESRYQVTMVLVGYHFNDLKNLAFEALDVQYTHLNEWARFDVFDVSEAWGSKEEQGGTIKYKQPEQVPPAMVDKYAISVVPRASLNLTTFPSKTVTLGHTSRIHAEPTSSAQITLAECNDLVSNMQDFLSLMMLEGIFPLAVEGTKHYKDSVQRVRLLYEPAGKLKPASKLRPQDIPFAFQTIREIITPLLQNFFNDSRMRPVYREFFSDFYGPPVYTEERFITMSTTLEAFHRRIYEEPGKDTVENLNTLSKLLDEWIDKMQPRRDLARELKSTLLSSYEMPFRKRLEQLLVRYGKPFVHAVVGEESTDQFLDDIVIMRKYYLTYDEHLEETASKGYDLLVLYSKLKLLCWVMFLNHIGIPENAIEDVLESQTRGNTSRFGFLRQSHR
jgi:hypothetical protein